MVLQTEKTTTRRHKGITAFFKRLLVRPDSTPKLTDQVITLVVRLDDPVPIDFITGAMHEAHLSDSVINDKFSSRLLKTGRNLYIPKVIGDYKMVHRHPFQANEEIAIYYRPKEDTEDRALIMSGLLEGMIHYLTNFLNAFDDKMDLSSLPLELKNHRIRALNNHIEYLSEFKRSLFNER